MKEIRNINSIVLEVSTDISDSSKRIKQLEEDEKYNNIIKENIKINKRTERDTKRDIEIKRLIEEKEKLEQNKRIDSLEKYLTEIKRRLTYIKLYHKYEDIKHKYLQNISFLKTQKDKHIKKLEYESYIRYYNDYANSKIEDIENTLLILIIQSIIKWKLLTLILINYIT